MDNGIKVNTSNMPSKKPQVSLRLEEHEYEELKEWAESEFRTPAALSAIIIKKTLAERRISTKNSNINVDEPDSTYLLKLLTSDKRPSDPDLIELAHDLQLDVKLLISLRDRLFPTRPKQPNGHK